MKKLNKKKFKDKKIGSWLRQHAPDILDSVGDLVPGAGALKVVSRFIEKHPTLGTDQKREAVALVDSEIKKVKKTEKIKVAGIVLAIIAFLSSLIGVSENCLNEIWVSISAFF